MENDPNLKKYRFKEEAYIIGGEYPYWGLKGEIVYGKPRIFKKPSTFRPDLDNAFIDLRYREDGKTIINGAILKEHLEEMPYDAYVEKSSFFNGAKKWFLSHFPIFDSPKTN